MTEENSEIAIQLKGIKKWVAVGAIGFMLIGVGVTIFSVSMMQMASVFEDDAWLNAEAEEESVELTWDGATELFEQGKDEELLSMINERLKSHPNDPSAHWFRAKVYYLNKEWAKALESVERTEMLSPNWKEEYTQPLREKIGELSQ